MEFKKMQCDNCKIDIIEYFNEKYNGNRGKCPICEIDFPLEWGYASFSALLT